MLFLVVDDDALSRELLTLLLEAEGYEVEAVSSGEAAVARLGSADGSGAGRYAVSPRASDSDSDSNSNSEDRKSLPDVVLTDVQMPGLAGDALAMALRVKLDAAGRPGAKTLLLAMSGSRPADSELSRFDGFLLKPFQVSDLRRAIGKSADAPPDALNSALGSPVDMALGMALGSALDEEIYARMSDLMPAGQLGQMYALCVDDARRRIARMETLAAEDDDAEYRKEAHAVKGASGMIGASELHQLAAAAEQTGLPARGKRLGTSSVTANLTRLSLACDRLERILQERTQGQNRSQGQDHTQD